MHHVWSLLTWRRVDAVVIAGFSGRSFVMAEVAMALCRLRRVRTVLFLHGGNLPVFGSEHRHRVERVLLAADLVLAPSDFLASTFRDWGVDVRIIPNVLALDRYRYAPRSGARPHLLWMRTFNPTYAPEMAVRVLAKVLERHPDARLSMAGADQGSLASTLAEIERLGVGDSVEMLGYLDLEGKCRAFAANDIYLNTNVVDNMPVSLLEAAASGLVPVATAVGGIPALVTDGVDGVLVDSGDEEAMVARVLELIEDPELYARLSAGARRLAERSGWPEVRKQWEHQFSYLLPELWVA
jgi:glycosyltransferase involved in cell wall biosynthesis